MQNKIQIGDFIKGSYKFGRIFGIVTDIKKSIVVIKQCEQYYNEYTLNNNLVNVTKKRINQIGLDTGEKINQKPNG
jgi:hypothetical protein